MRSFFYTLYKADDVISNMISRCYNKTVILHWKAILEFKSFEFMSVSKPWSLMFFGKKKVKTSLRYKHHQLKESNVECKIIIQIFNQYLQFMSDNLLLAATHTTHNPTKIWLQTRWLLNTSQRYNKTLCGAGITA